MSGSRCWGCRPSQTPFMDTPAKFDAVLTWDLPYDANLIEWSLSRISAERFCVMPLGADTESQHIQNFIVETPKNIWGAWQFKNDKIFAAISLPQHSADPETDGFYQTALVGQKARLLLSNEVITPVKVPPCCCAENSAVAAVSNLNWLMSSKKRAHPGPLEYIRQRERDYIEYNKKDRKDPQESK